MTSSQARSSAGSSASSQAGSWVGSSQRVLPGLLYISRCNEPGDEPANAPLSVPQVAGGTKLSVMNPTASKLTFCAFAGSLHGYLYVAPALVSRGFAHRSRVSRTGTCAPSQRPLHQDLLAKPAHRGSYAVPTSAKRAARTVAILPVARQNRAGTARLGYPPARRPSPRCADSSPRQTAPNAKCAPHGIP